MENKNDNRCEFCGEKLVLNKNDFYYYCPNPNCFRAMNEKIEEQYRITEKFGLELSIEASRNEIQSLETKLSDWSSLFWNYLFVIGILWADYKFITYGIPNNIDKPLSIVIYSIVFLIPNIIIFYLLREKYKDRMIIKKEMEKTMVQYEKLKYRLEELQNKNSISGV